MAQREGEKNGREERMGKGEKRERKGREMKGKGTLAGILTSCVPNL